MRLSTRSTYGIRALVELAFASGRGPVSAAHIATRQNLSVAYLEQLLHRLKKQGLVRSVRGPRGGYVLAKEPPRVTMGELVRILDGVEETRNGRSGDGYARSVANGKTGGSRVRPDARERGGASRADARGMQRHAQCVAQAVWRCVHERIMQSLDGVTLEDLCDDVKAAAGEPIDHRYVFHI